MDIPSMVMHEEADDNFIIEMLANGALHVVERPFGGDVFFRIRQCVIREHLNKLESECSTDGKKKVTMSKTKRNSNIQLHENGTGFAKKKSLEWTDELHSNFLRVSHQLAREGRCFPKDILVGMGVPGLTRMQVASHLQNCRRGGLKFTENQGLPSASRNGSSNSSQEEVNSKRCGHTPLVVTSFENQKERIKFNDGTLSGNEVEKDKDLMNNQSLIGSSSRKNYGFQNHGQVGSKRCKKGSNPFA
ncbi:putative transcription factor MYB-HB-like family [Helianthus anomalus]